MTSIFRILLPCLCAVVLFLTVLPAQPVLADSAGDVLQKIRERAKAWGEIVDIIKSNPDQRMRIAAFEEAVKSGDPELRLSAMEAAFASDDKRLRKAALRHHLNAANEIRVDFLVKDDPSVIEDKFYSAFHGLLFHEIKVDNANDAISVDEHFWSGTLIQDGFDMTFNSRGFAQCVLTMRLADARRMTGRMNCVLHNKRWLRETEGQNKVQLPATVSLH